MEPPQLTRARIISVLEWMHEIEGHNTVEEFQKRNQNFSTWKEYVLFEAVRLLLLAELQRTDGWNANTP